MACIMNSGQNLPRRDSNNLVMLKSNLIVPAHILEEKSRNHMIIQPKANRPKIETHIFSHFLHVNNISLI